MGAEPSSRSNASTHSASEYVIPQLEGPRADDDRKVALPFGELVDQTGLADARLASHQHDTERTRADQGQLLIQRSDLGVPSDKGRPKRNADQMA
jgi:hypothetical protein